MLVTGMLIGHSLNGQDVFYSQFYNSPMTLNPGLTGFTASDMQFVLNYRNNSQGLIPYSTYSASGEMKLARMRLKPDIAAVGAMALMDNFNKGALKTFNFRTSGAYHRALGPNYKHYITIGVQLGILQRHTNPDAFSYPVQWVENVGYNENLPNKETYVQENTLNFDLTTGVFWYGTFNEKISGFSGFSVFHLNNPRQTFLGNEERFSRRFVVHGGIKYKINSGFFAVPNMIAMFHNKARQITEGVTFEFHVEDSDMALRLGSWFRHSDVGAIVVAGVKYKDFQFAVSSDFISRLQTIARSQSAIEFSLVYSHSLKEVAELKANPRNKY